MKKFSIKKEVLELKIESLRNRLEESILIYGTSDKRVLNISQQLDKVLTFYLMAFSQKFPK